MELPGRIPRKGFRFTKQKRLEITSRPRKRTGIKIYPPKCRKQLDICFFRIILFLSEETILTKMRRNMILDKHLIQRLQPDNECMRTPGGVCPGAPSCRGNCRPSIHLDNECMRTSGGNCRGNCRPRIRLDNECMRTPGGTCQGNCRPRIRLD